MQLLELLLILRQVCVVPDLQALCSNCIQSLPQLSAVVQPHLLACSTICSLRALPSFSTFSKILSAICLATAAGMYKTAYEGIACDSISFDEAGHQRKSSQRLCDCRLRWHSIGRQLLLIENSDVTTHRFTP
jgi:hypothetical protein